MLESVLSTLVGVNVPLVLPVLCGVILALTMKLDSKPLLTVALYALVPAVIFKTLMTAKISGTDVLQTVAFSVLTIGLLWGIAKALARGLDLSDQETAGLTLIGTLTNSVNYGLPLVLLAFGQVGLDKASVYVIGQMIFVNTGGVYLAARSNFSGRDALKAVFRLPAVYAAVLAAGFRVAGISLPNSLNTGISMVAQAYSPVALLILGTQMASVGRGREESSGRAAFWAGLGLRMVAAPLVAWSVLSLLGVTGMLRAVLLVEASMPVAVNAVILGEKFAAVPRVLARCILWTTVASFFFLPVLIALASR